MKLKAAFWCAYLIAALLTGANYYNHGCSERSRQKSLCGVEAWYIGTVWPIYWAVRGAVEVTK